MTPAEFKSWFDGFTEAMSGIPTKAQWARIKERVGEIDGKPVTERHFIDRYYPSYPRPYWSTYYSAGSVGSNTMLLSANNAASQGASMFCASTAMNALGRADAKALAA